MSLCINPKCPQPDNPANNNHRFCQSCGSELLIGGRYRVKSLLSDKSGFGKIYEAEEAGAPQILKVLKDELNANAKAVELFQQEAVVLGQLNHPGIPKEEGYFTFSTRNGPILHCIVMEKIDGPNLQEWQQQRGNRPINEDQAIAWLKQLTEILQLVHSQKYFHRDIKPSNIMLRANGQLVLIDFGTAREVTYTYMAARNAGNPITAIESRGYTPPEQANGQAVPQSDFFALGRTFVQLMTGRYPLDMYDPHNDTLNWRPHASHISPLVLDFVDWLMERQIDKRPANTQAMLQRLREIEIELAETVNVVGGLRRGQPLPQPTAQRNKYPLWWIGAALIALWVFLGDALRNLFSPPPARSQPQNSKIPFLVLLAVLLPLFCLAALAVLEPAIKCLGSSSQECLPRIKRPFGQAPQRKGKVDYFPYEKGTDSQGRTAEFNIAVLSIEYKWKFGSSYQIQYNDRVINVDQLKSYLEEQGIYRIMENPTEVISIGTASCEGKPATEERRAFERAKQIQLLTKSLFGKVSSVKGYRLLNLGQFVGEDCQSDRESTSYQRSLIIMGVKRKSEGVVLDEALRSRLVQKPFADFSLEDYSMGSAERFKTIPSNVQ